MAKNIHLYSSKECPHCIELKELLNKHNLPYEVIDVDEEEKVWDELCETLDVKFVPTVIIVDETKDTAKVLTPDIHFDEVQECFDEILEEVNDNKNS